MLNGLVTDVRLALRWFTRSPGFTSIAIVSLAVGIGFNATVFNLIDALLLKPLPVRAPEQLVDVFTSGTDGDQYSTSSYLDYLDIRERNEVFSDMMGFSPMVAAQNLTDRSRMVLGEVVTGNYFRVLGVSAFMGRTIEPGDDAPEAGRVAVVSYGYWRRELGAAPDVLGQTIRLRGHAYTIVGVAPAWFSGMTPLIAPSMWVPVARVGEVDPAGISDSVASPTGTSWLDRRGQRWMFMKGRLKPGVTAEAAQANLQVIMAQLATVHQQTNKDRRMSALPTSKVRLHPAAGQALLPIAVGLMTALGLALLIVCANVASMLLARASARTRELAIRQSLGAGRVRVVRLLFVESLTLAMFGGALGILLTWWLNQAVVSLELGLPIPLSLTLGLNARVLAFTTGIATLAGLAAGLAPALRVWRTDLMRDLHAGGGSPGLVGRRWTSRDALVALQLGVTMVLLVSGGLLARSLMASGRADVGFDPAGLAALATDSELAGYEDDRSEQFWDQAVARVRAIPGVHHVAMASRLPFSINFSNASLHIPGHNTPGDAGTPVSSVNVSPEYFDTLGVRILEGRGFAATDTPETPRVAVVNQTMARRFWPGRSAVGQRVMLRSSNNLPVEIVGVVANHRVSTVGEAPQPQIHFAQTQRLSSYRVLVARAGGDAERLLMDMRRTLLELEPNLVFIEDQTMASQVAATLLPVRAGAWLVGVIGLVGALLAAIGLYGTIAYSVAQRTREIGIRLAIGSTPSGILAMVMRHGARVAAAGIGLGVPLAAGAGTLIAGAVYGVGVADPVAWSLAVLGLLGVAALANVVPAWRASRLKPGIALRVD